MTEKLPRYQRYLRRHQWLAELQLRPKCPFPIGPHQREAIEFANTLSSDAYRELGRLAAYAEFIRLNEPRDDHLV
jgi:hypothetical protein